MVFCPNRYVEQEYPKSGVLAPLQTLTFVKKYMPQHHGLIFHLMELVVKKDASHRFVSKRGIFILDLTS